MKTFGFILVSTCLLVISRGSVADESSGRRKYTILEHDNLLVRCNATQHPDIFVYWSKNDTKQNFHQNGTDLTIFDVTREYSGSYVCHALNTSYVEFNDTDANVTVEVIDVDVQYPGEVKFFSVGPHELLENQTFTITCNFQGNPAPHWMIWNRNTSEKIVQATLPASGSLGVVARCDSSGYWECTGRNRLNHGVNASQGADVTVFCPPRPVFSQPATFYSVVGKDAVIHVDILSNPRPTFTWTRLDGQTARASITTSDKFTDLEIQRIKVSEFGVYVLEMKNKYGSHKSMYKLAPKGSPETPANLTFSHVTYDSVRLHWTSGFDMGSQQHFMVMQLTNGNEFRQISPNIYDTSSTHGVNATVTYHLQGLSSRTFFNISIMAENNDNFQSGFSNNIQFTTNDYPYPPPDEGRTNMGMIIGVVLGSVGLLGLLAGIVYIVKWRRLKTSYDTIKT